MAQLYQGFETGAKAGAPVTFKPKSGAPAGFGKRHDRPAQITGRPAAAPMKAAAASVAVIGDTAQSLLLRPALELDQVIRIHRERFSRHEYTPVGKLKMVVFGEPAAGAPVPPRDETRIWGIRLDWMG